MKPDLTPTTPFEPISVTMLWTVPTSGRLTVDRPAIWANAGMLIPAAAIRRVSAAVDTDIGS